MDIFRSLAIPSFPFHLILGCVIAAGQTVSLWAQPSSQELNGRVVDHGGAPVPGARVRAVLLAAGVPSAATVGPTTPALPPRGRSVKAAAGGDGTFSLTSVPAGLYQICVSVPGKELLDPCVWRTTPAPVLVGGGGAAATGRTTVQLLRGAELRIRVEDPDKLLAAAEKSGKGHVLVGASGPNGMFVPARVAVEDAKGRTYTVAIPVGVAAKLTISPFGIGLRDEVAGQPLGVTAKGGGQQALTVLINEGEAAAGRLLRYSVSSALP